MLSVRTDMPGGVQALEALGTVTADDYRRVFAPLVDRIQRSERRMRLLYQFGPGFKRITAGALLADARLGVRYARLLDGCAVVTDVGWIRLPTRRIGAFMPCPVRTFHNEERDEAAAWLNSLHRGADVSASDIAKAYIGGTSAMIAGLGHFVIASRTKRRQS